MKPIGTAAAPICGSGIADSQLSPEPWYKNREGSIATVPSTVLILLEERHR